MKSIPVSSAAEIIRGVVFARDEVREQNDQNAVPIIRAMNILEDGTFLFDDLLYVDAERVSEKQKIRKHDVVIAASTGSKKVIGKAAQAKSDWNGGFGGFCLLLRPNDQLDPQYFGYFFQTKAYRNQISHMASGANINNLKRRHFDELSIPLLPIDQQRKLVIALEHADSLRLKHKESIVLLEDYTQAVLQRAYSEIC